MKTKPVIMHFVPVETIQKIANDQFEIQKIFLHKLIPLADIQHVGATSVPGSLTKGDLDIQVRVPKNKFVSARTILDQHYKPNHQDDIWTEEFASFENYANPAIPIGIQLTVQGSNYDEFYKIRDLFINNPELLKRYNAIKKQCEGKSSIEYRKHKRQLFGVNGANPLLAD